MQAIWKILKAIAFFLPIAKLEDCREEGIADIVGEDAYGEGEDVSSGGRKDRDKNEDNASATPQICMIWNLLKYS